MLKRVPQKTSLSITTAETRRIDVLHADVLVSKQMPSVPSLAMVVKNYENTPDCPNISSMTMRTQRGHRVRNQQDHEGERQRHNSAEQWTASKDNDLTAEDDSKEVAKEVEKGRGSKIAAEIVATTFP